MARVAPAHFAAMALGVAGLAMLFSGLAGESRNGIRILFSVLLISGALIVSGLQALLGAHATTPASGQEKGET